MHVRIKFALAYFIGVQIALSKLEVYGPPRFMLVLNFGIVASRQKVNLCLLLKHDWEKKIKTSKKIKKKKKQVLLRCKYIHTII